ncbi:MAG TPA: transglutaminase domain-containing protein, partial [Gammaproteobacteria bacterium]|nr:transglutaminase domain-containing protein [Gammaproteobacteria bacterium]
MGLHKLSPKGMLLGICAGLCAFQPYALGKQGTVPAQAADFTGLQRQYAQALAAGADTGKLLGQLRALAGAHAIVPQPPAPDQAFELNSRLDAFAARLRAFLDTANPGRADIDALYVAWMELQAAHLLMQENFNRVGARLEQGGAGSVFGQRLRGARDRYQSAAEDLLGLFETVWTDFPGTGETASRSEHDIAPLAAKLRKAAAKALPLIEQRNGRPQPEILGATFLPYRRIVTAQRNPDTANPIQPSYLNPGEPQPAAADMAGTADAPLAPEILEQAQALGHDYIRIYEFVRNGIRTEWYAGGMKGALGALRQRAGNDVDQASLLIALFRASGLACRYVHGVIELPVSKVAQSLGLADAALVTKALGQAGIAYSAVISGGRISSVKIEHTWVTAYIPYTNYRGAMVDASGGSWLPLMPALKDYQITPATGVLKQLTVTVDQILAGYLQQRQPSDLLQQVRGLVQQYLQNSGDTAGYESKLGSITVKSESLGLLPNTVPVSVTAVTAEAPELADTRRHRMHVVMYKGVNANDEKVLDYSAPLAQLAGERLTLSYLPATVDDQKTTNLFGGLDLAPAYLIELRPQLRINGRQTAVGAGVLATGVPHRLEIEITGPNGIERIERRVLSGSYHALALTAGETAHKVPENDPADTEYLGAKLLDSVAYEYAAQWDAAEREFAGLLDVALIRPLPSLAIVSNSMRVDTVLGQPARISWEAVTLDAVLRVAQPLARNGEAARESDFMRLAALQGSALEHGVFEQLFLAESVSADRGLQLAAAQSLNILTLNSANFAAQKSLLTHPASAAADIANWVGLGFTVTTPAQAIQLQNWRGHVWRVENPANGAGGYFIAGGLAGGSTAGGAWILEWLRKALAAANSPPPNLNPGEAASISVLGNTDGQTGEAGQPLETPLAVIVRDSGGAAVEGATVTFRVTAGGAKFNGADATTAVTDQFGIASAVLTLGEKTDNNSIFVIRNPGEQYSTQAALNQIDASVDSDFGTLMTVKPFSALTLPGAPAQLKLVSNKQLDVIPGLPLANISALVVDQYENTISNIPVTASIASSQQGTCPPFQNGAVYDAKVRADGSSNCPNPVLGMCGQASVTVNSRFDGVFVAAIAGLGFRLHNITVQAPGLAALQFGYSTNQVAGIPADPIRPCEICPVLSITRTNLINEFGEIIAATRAGERYENPIRVSSYLSDGTNVFTPFGAGLGITFSALTAGASMSGTSARGAGEFEAFLTTSPIPGLNNVQAVVTGLNSIPLPDYCDNGGRPYWADKSTFTVSGAFGVDPRIKDVSSLNTPEGISPASVYVNADQRSEYPFKIKYDVAPEIYRSGLTQVLLYEDGAILDARTGSTRKGPGEVTLPRGTVLDPTRLYEAELVLNGGSRTEVRSDRFQLPIRNKLIKSYTRSVLIQQQVDLLNQRSCDVGYLFEFELTESARVTLEMADETNEHAKTRLIDDEPFASGAHSHSIAPGELMPGKYTFTLTAVADRDGAREE